MITTIARKEMLETFRDQRFRVAGGIVLAMLMLAVFAGWRQYRDLERQHSLAQKETRDNWLHQGEKNPHSAAHYGVYAFKPKPPLSLMDRGVDPYTGVAVWLEAHKQNDFQYRPAQDSNTLARLGELTAATVLQVLVPLLIVLFAFGAFAGEREQGTLRQVLSLGVPARTLASGKALGVAGALGLLLVPAAVLGASALMLAGSPRPVAEDLPRLALMVLFYLLYFAAFIGVSLAISAWSRSARGALVGLLAFWIFNCLVAPRAVSDLSKRAHPTPSSYQFMEAMATEMAGGADHSTPEKRLAALKEKLFKQYGVNRVEDLPINFTGVSLAESEEHGNQVFDKHWNELWDRYESQIRFQESASVAAPLLAVRSLSMGLAGTDFQQHRHFASAAEKYRRYFIGVMNEDIAANAPKEGTYLRKDDLWSKVKEFEYSGPSLSWVLQQHSTALALLMAWAAGSALLAYWATSRLRLE